MEKNAFSAMFAGTVTTGFSMSLTGTVKVALDWLPEASVGTADEALGVRKVLDAAAWTYVAAFVTSLVYFLVHLLPLLMGRRDD